MTRLAQLYFFCFLSSTVYGMIVKDRTVDEEKLDCSDEAITYDELAKICVPEVESVAKLKAKIIAKGADRIKKLCLRKNYLRIQGATAFLEWVPQNLKNLEKLCLAYNHITKEECTEAEYAAFETILVQVLRRPTINRITLTGNFDKSWYKNFKKDHPHLINKIRWKPKKDKRDK